MIRHALSFFQHARFALVSKSPCGRLLSIYRWMAVFLL
jgi:hypothetical protein